MYTRQLIIIAETCPFDLLLVCPNAKTNCLSNRLSMNIFLLPFLFVDLRLVYNDDTAKLFRLLQQCQERALTIISSIGKIQNRVVNLPQCLSVKFFGVLAFFFAIDSLLCFN